MAETPVGVFPDYKIFGSEPLQLYDEFNTEILQAPSGREQRILWQDDLRRWGGTLRPLQHADRKVVRDFLNAHKGRYASFYFWVPLPEDVADFDCGALAAPATSITLPAIKGPWWLLDDGPVAAAAYSQVTVDNVPVDFTATPNIGTFGQDRINFGAPQSGAVKVTAVNARLLVVARNDTDSVQHALMLGVADVRTVHPIVIKELVP
ncbi:MAG TPA: hypothetical protein VHU41_17960 [Thermoanaerobaculia bacterium]|jgi:hypothetical protein|nr:hypothetical protein [Thermoanaerobaculia bacterium]